MLTGESEPAGAAPVPAQSAAARPKSSRRGRYSKPTDINTVHSLLVKGVVNPRPKYLCNHASTDNETFLEQPVLARRRGWDRWITSGGRKGGTETWLSDTDGVLKRYLRVVATDPAQPVLKGAQYSLLKRLGPGAEAVEDKTKYCWVINRNTASAPQQPQDQVKLEDLVPQMAQVQTAMDLGAGPGQSFISFQSSVPGEEGLELGAVVRHGVGVKLESAQGDFAEWHQRVPGEPPFDEGDVVGFHRGRISRVTKRCEMLGVVSRKAIVEGSAPPAAQRNLWDTVAYCGVVPVKLISSSTNLGSSCSVQLGGQLVTPSGRNDGTAVIASGASNATPRVGILHDANYAQLHEGSGYQLVSVMVVAPAETVRGQAAAQTMRFRNLVLCLLASMAVLSAAITAYYKLHGPSVSPEPALSICARAMCARGSHRSLERSSEGGAPCCVDNICRSPSTSRTGIGLFDEIGWTGSVNARETLSHKRANQCSNGGALGIVNGSVVFSPGCSQVPAGWSSERAVSTCQELCMATDACAGFTLYDETPQDCAQDVNVLKAAKPIPNGSLSPCKPQACCFYTNVADVPEAEGVTKLNGPLMHLARMDFSRQFSTSVPGLERSSRCFLKRSGSAYSIQNPTATRVTDLGVISCSPGWSTPPGSKVNATCPPDVESSNVNHSAPDFDMTGCVANQCRPFYESVSYNDPDFQKRHPPQPSTVSDFLGGGTIEEAFHAFLAGSFSNTSDSADGRLARFIVENATATTVRELGNIGCRLGYTGRPSMDCRQVSRKKDGGLFEAAKANPLTEVATGFVGSGCVPSDSCRSLMPCDNTYGEQRSHCESIAAACASAQSLFTTDVVANHATCDAVAGGCCNYCVIDQRLPLLMPSVDPETGEPLNRHPAMKCAESVALQQGKFCELL